MPDQIPPVAADAAAIEENNKRLADKVAAQDIMGQSTAPGDVEPAQKALDDLLAKAESAAKEKEAAPADDVAADEAAKKAAADEAAKKAEAAKEDPSVKRAEELFKDSPTPPPNASSKTNDAFQSVKQRAAKEILEREQELAKIKAELEETKKKFTEPSEEVKKSQAELQELRKWRAKMDVEFDPEFKKFDQQIHEANEFIYSQLKQSPAVTDETIKLIKELGGPRKVNMAKIFTAVNDPTLQRLVEGQLSEVAKLEYQKNKAMTTARTNVDQYMQERESHWKNAATAHTSQTQAELDGMLKSLDWFVPRKVADNAEAEAKQQAEEHNKFVGELDDQLKAAVQDDSPKMRAVLVAGMAQLFNLQREHTSLKAKFASMEKELTTKAALLDKVKASATTRLREGGAPAEGVRPAAAKAPGTERADDALDRIAKQVMEERKAKGID